MNGVESGGIQFQIFKRFASVAPILEILPLLAQDDAKERAQDDAKERAPSNTAGGQDDAVGEW